MKIVKISELDFSDLTVGHLILLQDECDMVTAQLTGAAVFPPQEFRKSALRIVAASNSIATAAGSGKKSARTLAEVDEIAEQLVWDVSASDILAAAMHALNLIPAKPGQNTDPGEKKPTG